MDEINKEAQNLYNNAQESYEEAKRLLKELKFADSVDKFHDTIENALKSLLTLYDTKYKPTHDVSNYLYHIKDKMDKTEPNYIYYCEIVLPPFIVIHKVLLAMRNFARYSKGDISTKNFINDGIAQSINVMVETNYPMLISWITEMLYSPKTSKK